MPITPENLAGRVQIRPARDGDRAAMEYIAARTWDGWDYLPNFITAWLADSDGVFFVATLREPDAGPDAEGQVVGTGKLTRLGPGEWWLEGLRVDPDMYGRGIGRALHDYGVAQAEARAVKGGMLRFATNIDNPATPRMAADTGFVEVCRMVRYKGSANSALAGQLYPLAAETAHLDAARAFLTRSAHYQAVGQSVVDRRWRCSLITDERLAVWADKGWLFGWQHKTTEDQPQARLDGLVIARQDALSDGPELTVIYMDAVPGRYALVAQAVRGLAAEQNCQLAWHMAVTTPERLVAIEQAGWRRPTDDSGKAVLYSRPLGA